MAKKLRKTKIDSKKLLERLIGLIPIIFAAFVSGSFVWHFSASKTPFLLSFSGAFIYQLILFTVFDTARRPRRKFLFAVYILIILIISPYLSEFYEVIMYSQADQLMHETMVFDWFFGSGSYTRYNPGYCFYLLMLMSLPIGAAVYFYTKVYLRISVLFLIALFPPIIYAKDYETYPPFLCVILMLLFFATIIYCKFLKTDENIANSNDGIWQSSQFRFSTAAFLAISIFVAIIIPKPDIDDKRQEFDDFTQGRFSSRTGRITDNFTNSSNGNNTANTSNRELARIEANELLNLKTQCYYYYDDSEDVWLPLEQDSELMQLSRYYMTRGSGSQSESEIEMYSPAELIEDIIYACNKDFDFAEKYSLEALIDENVNMGDYRAFLCYYSVNENFCPSYFLVPENAYNLKISNNLTETTIIKSDSSVLYPIYEPTGGLLCYRPGQLITIDYISPRLIYDDRAQTVLRALSYEDYEEFLVDLYSVTGSLVAYDAYREFEVQDEIYENESERVFTKKIRDLAKDITDGLYSDYEKAKAIEQYFAENGYEYDTDYVCPEGENITHFIFDEQEGSCYHYATAMTLLCRSVGLNARYCEGFSYSEKVEDTYSSSYDGSGNTSYKIDESCSHAFCEVYISGYGWMRFEPTVADDSFSMGSKKITVMVMIILTISLILAILFTLIVYPILERMYLVHLAKTNKPATLCRYIIKSIRKAIDSTAGESALEIAVKASSLSDVDLTDLAILFNSCIYGNCQLDYEQMTRMIHMLYAFRKNYSKQKRHSKANKRTLSKKEKTA